jgi:tetratricopeptide (TPR) repeat protein
LTLCLPNGSIPAVNADSAVGIFIPILRNRALSMIIERKPPKYPRRGPSCLLVILVLLGIGFSTFVIQNADEVRDVIIPTPTPEPTRSATEYAVLADLAERDGDFEEAVGYYEKALELDATKPEIYIRLINLLVEIDDPERALEIGEQAVVLAPDNDAVWTAVAKAYIANGDRLDSLGDPTGASLQYAEAVRAAEKAVDINPENATAYAYMAAGLVLPGDARFYDRAQEMADYAVFLEPDNPIAHYYMATVFTYLGFYTEARQEYQIGIQADPTNIDLYIGLAYNFFGTGNVPEAILTFEDATAIDPNNAVALDGLAYMYIQLGQYPTAEEYALQAVEADPNLARAWGRLGEAYYQQNNYPKAIESLETAVNLYGDATDLNARFFYFLASAYIRNSLDDCDKAVPLFNEVLNVSPLYQEAAQEGIATCRLAPLNTDS